MRGTTAKATLACAIAGCLAVGSALAQAAASTDFASTLAIGMADIEIEAVSPADGATVSSGEPVASSCAIANAGDACWVRVRTDAVPPANAAPAAGGAWVEGDDGYWYLSHVLAEGETATFAQTLEFSAVEAKGATIEVERTITAEAVQAAAFTPDFDASRPWGDVEPQRTTVAHVEGAIGSDAPAAAAIVFRGAKDGFSPAGGNLLSQIGTVSPGQTASGSFSIENATDEAWEFSLSIDADADVNAATQAIAERVWLLVADAATGDVRYEGSLLSPDLAEGADLRQAGARGKIELSYDIALPADIGNEAAGARIPVPLVLTAYDAGASSTAPGAMKPADPPADAEGDRNASVPLAQTGSTLDAAIIAALSAIVAAGCAVAFLAKGHAFVDPCRSEPRRRNR